MRTILICPGERPAVGFLAQAMPLVTVPALGQPLLSYWMDWLVANGCKRVLLLATDRPEMVRSVVGDGSRWGLQAEVQAELTELTPADVRKQFGLEDDSEHASGSGSVIKLEHLPGLPNYPLFQSYQCWFNAVLTRMTCAPQSHRVGLREIQPQIWCGRRAHIAPNAVLRGPCWIGDHVRVGVQAVIGPNAVLEDRVVVDSTSEIRSSIVGPDTFVGALTRVEDSIAWGNTLIHWKSGSCTQVPDSFLLSALGHKYLSEPYAAKSSWLSQGLLNALVRPWELVADLRAKLRSRPQR